MGTRAGEEAGAAAAWFGRCFGRPAEIAWRAPGRVNLIGEHTDYNDGLVLPFALTSSVTVAVAGRGDGLLELRSRQVPGDHVVLALRDLAPGAVTGWAAYPAGVAWALRADGVQLAGASVAIDSSLPRGAGLASSAALECAAAGALASMAGRTLSRAELAACARRAENEFVGVPCGIMDQLAAMFCQAGHALLIDCRTGEHTAVPLEPAAAGLALVVIDTRARHELTAGGYAARRSQCEQAAASLGVPSLRDVSDAGALAALGDPLLASRARHVITENERVRQVARLLESGRLAECGPLLTSSHRSLREDYQVSWAEADIAVEAALAAGALGARMTGAGFGGCVLALIPAGNAAAVTAGVRAALAAAGAPEPEFSVAVPGQAAGGVPFG